MLSMLVGACDDSPQKDQAYVFIGDSIAARWPVDQSFPSRLVYNCGLSGSGNDYLRSMAGRQNGKNVVVVSGTNDFQIYYPDLREAFVAQYLEAIYALTDRTIYLYCVLPREFGSDSPDIIDKIAAFNNLVKARLDAYPRIVYVDVFDDFLCEGHINYQYYSDGLHLSAYGYDVLATRLLKILNN